MAALPIPPRFERVGRFAALPEAVVLGIEVDGEHIAVVRVGGEVFAVADRCPHQGARLSRAARVDGCWITCWLHGARFDLRTGDALAPAGTAPLRTYPVRLVVDAAGTEWVDIGKAATVG